ncbi:hypothetical protein ACVWWQ_001911 [Rhodanobacter sp. TND4EL1]
MSVKANADLQVGNRRSSRDAPTNTVAADLANSAVMATPTMMSGQRVPVNQTAAAAAMTPRLAMRSLREHNHTELMLMSSARWRQSMPKHTPLAAAQRALAHRDRLIQCHTGKLDSVPGATGRQPHTGNAKLDKVACHGSSCSGPYSLP